MPKIIPAKDSIWMEKSGDSRAFIVTGVFEGAWVAMKPWFPKGGKKDAVIVHTEMLPRFFSLIHNSREGYLLRLTGRVSRSGGVTL